MGPQQQLRRQFRVEGAVRPGSTIPTAQVSDPRVPGDTDQFTSLPHGQAEDGRTQDSKDTPAAGCAQAVQISALQPQSIQASAEWETVVVTARADSRAGELSTTIAVVPSGVTQCLGASG